MANLITQTERRVIPNWRSFANTLMLGELNSFKIQQDKLEFKNSIEDYIFDWRENKQIINASELLSAAFVNNNIKIKDVREAAEFILKNKYEATFSQVSLAERLLNFHHGGVEEIDFSKIDINNFSEAIDLEIIKAEIARLKKLINEFNSNAILYVELSRYYSIIGQEKQAISSMKKALHFAPSNRFVLRSATRLFSHFRTENNDYLEYIHNFLYKSTLMLKDPWLTSAEIAISTIRNRSSKFIKTGIAMINSADISPFNFTELASSIGTVELLNGSTKKSRNYFKKALLAPNDNSLAQVEWAINRDIGIQIDQLHYEVKLNFEAMALEAYHNHNIEDALKNAAKWFVDMPFSSRPIIFASNLASTVLEDHDTAISFLNAGLKSNPVDPMLINNLAYALALSDRPLDALEQLNKIKIDSIEKLDFKICLLATNGLALMRCGLIEEGRRLYLSAIEKTKELKDVDLINIAILNFAREELRIKSKYVDSIMDLISKIPESKIIEIKTLKNRVISQYQKWINEV